MCLTKIASANNFYLNFDYGSDAANGSSTATAWKTWDKIRSYGAGSNYQPGDTISLLNGDTWAQVSSYWTGMGSGSPGNHIVLGGWGSSTTRATVETNGTEEQDNYGISLRNMSYWTIQDLFFWNADWAPIYINGDWAHVSNIKIYNCEVSTNYAPFHYIRLGTYPASWDVSNIEIGSTTVHGTQSVYGDNTTNIDFVNAERVTSGLWVHDVTGYWGAQQGMLADVAGGDGHIVEYNKAWEVGGLLKFHGQQLALTNATGRYNIIYDTPQVEGTNNVAVILQECQNTYVYNNSVYMGNHGVGACMVWDKYPNQLLGTTDNLVIQNNIFYGSRLSEAAFIVGGNNGTMTQAIFEDKTTCNHNLYYKTNGYAIKLSVDGKAINNGSGSASWQADHPGDLFVDPLFVDAANDDYHLAWNSPCIDAGIAVNATHTQSLDLDKNPIYGTPDIGCYEYQPPFTMGTDAIDTTGTIRMYSNGKYRYKTGTSSGTLASLDIYQAAGRLSGTYSQWLDLSFTSWTANKKAWTETPGYGTNTRHVVSGLTNGSYYAVQVNGATQTTKIASDGAISFDNVIGDSPTNFEVNLTAGSGSVSASGGGSVTCSGSGNIICQ